LIRIVAGEAIRTAVYVIGGNCLALVIAMPISVALVGGPFDSWRHFADAALYQVVHWMPPTIFCSTIGVLMLLYIAAKDWRLRILPRKGLSLRQVALLSDSELDELYKEAIEEATWEREKEKMENAAENRKIK
jgi:hypothetical protein